MYIDDLRSYADRVRSCARGVFSAEHDGLSLIMIDYLHRMRAVAFDNRTLEIAEISRSLKALAKEPVCRSWRYRSLTAPEQRADKRPVNSDLRESGLY